MHKQFQFHEAGVSYCREPSVGWLQFQYNWLQIFSQKSGVGNIWLYEEEEYAKHELLILINHWNTSLPRLWKYWL